MNSDSKTKIFFYEAHPLMILGVKALIEKDPDLDLCGFSSKHDTLIDELTATAPDILILDLSLYTEESINFIRKVRGAFPKLGIVLLSVHSQPDCVAKARAAGVNSYLLKVEEPDLILEAVRATAAGESYISSRVRQPEDIGAPSPDSPINLLSKLEFQILQQIGKGRTNHQVAEDLQLPVETIESETETIQTKLDLTSPVELLQFAFHWVHHEGGFS